MYTVVSSGPESCRTHTAHCPSYTGPWPSVRHNQQHSWFMRRTKVLQPLIPGMSKPQGILLVSRPFFTARINPDPRGNRDITAENPATESSVVQGMRELQELSFSDQKCKTVISHLSDRNGQHPGSGPMVGTVRDGNNPPGRYKTRE